MDSDELKQILREYAIEHKREIGIGLILVLASWYFMANMGCSYKINNQTVYGNCKTLYNLQEDIDQTLITRFNIINKTPVIEPIIINECPPPDPCPLCPTCTTQSTLPVTTITCPECVCETQLNEKTEDQLLNLRIEGVAGAAAFSGGFFKCKQQVLDILGLKPIPGSTFDEPLVRVPPVWYGVREESDDVFCFRDLGGYFILNRTPDMLDRKRWSWNDENCKNSWLRVNHL